MHAHLSAPTTAPLPPMLAGAMRRQVATLLGGHVLDVRALGDDERAFCAARFGDVPVDRVANFLLVHADAPRPDLRAARIEDVRTAFLPNRFEDHRTLVTGGAVFCWSSPGYAPKVARGLPAAIRADHSIFTKEHAYDGEEAKVA